MAYIKRAIISKVFSGSGFETNRLSFYLSDDKIIKADLDLEIKENDLVIKEFEGANIEDDFIEAASVLWQENKVIGNKSAILANIVAAKCLAILDSKPLYRILSDYYDFEPKMPKPLLNVFNGGLYGDTNLDFDEYLLIPSIHNKSSLKEFLDKFVKTRNILGELLFKKGFDTDIGLFGGYAPDLVSSINAFEFIITAALKAGFNFENDIFLGVSIGAHHLFDTETKKYLFQLDRHYLGPTDLAGVYQEWFKRYNIGYLEDLAAISDKESWKKISAEFRDIFYLASSQISNHDLAQKFIDQKIGNTVVIKLNQFAGFFDLLKFVKQVKKYNYGLILASAINETEDDFLADLSVALPFDGVKFGSLARSERVSKYNRLIEIERELADFI
ncbi:MAG: hypothetical protein PHR00_00220 [Patescibacteria group bacterium]|nr:hypothetical protein [Patescibacteria group bacterium]